MPALSPKKTRVLVGLSGGVDSSVAALLLLERGYDVSGAMMAVYDGPPGPAGASACYDRAEAEDIGAAASLCRDLGIPFRVFDLSARYKKIVLDYFRSSYLAGQTPNPCVRCNQRLKFGLLPALAAQAGMSHAYFATGHYARVEFSQKYTRPVLRRGLDESRDQSYFLYRLSHAQLARSLFPLGEMRKAEVRDLARKRGLPMHDKADSQDFFAGDYTELLGVAPRPGPIVDQQGHVLGEHSGFWRFTPGQRRGLGLAAPAPLYVLKTDAKRNAVVVGGREDGLIRSCRIEKTRLNVPEALDEAGLCARLRSSQKPTPVRARQEAGGHAHVEFIEPQGGVAAGQSLVFCLDDLIVGGGIIRENFS
ncbi:MAG: tRNA 2-thiouridine(34) synthase MnmA [Desulfovibrio sp.]|jgi:tRNA-specific 2-thiouridylase|nr:tRNA 2-thiouridine(34) synthase MnmA [Desulfovibrio sp.]